MHDGYPSLTASIVAAARAVGVPPADPLAADLLPRSLTPWIRAASHAPPPLLSLLSCGLTDHMALRTRAIDEALREAIEVRSGELSQVVVLGAGLDARAYRLRDLANTVVFEVDHPATQSYKRARIGDRASCAREVRFVAVDFEHMDLGDKLAQAGHDEAKQTFWIWEGVTPYLHVAAIRATLEIVGSRSAPGSRAAITYGTPDMTFLGPLVGLAAIRAFHVLGEPLYGLIAQRQFCVELERIAYRILWDEGVRDWAKRFEHPRRRALVIDERLVVAERR
jgi:methyltransferase (TIGR00027 family)